MPWPICRIEFDEWNDLLNQNGRTFVFICGTGAVLQTFDLLWSRRECWNGQRVNMCSFMPHGRCQRREGSCTGSAELWSKFTYRVLFHLVWHELNSRLIIDLVSKPLRSKFQVNTSLGPNLPVLEFVPAFWLTSDFPENYFRVSLRLCHWTAGSRSLFMKAAVLRNNVRSLSDFMLATFCVHLRGICFPNTPTLAVLRQNEKWIYCSHFILLQGLKGRRLSPTS